MSESRTYLLKLSARLEVSVALTGMTIDFDCTVAGNRCTNRGGTRDDSWTGTLAAGEHKIVVYPYVSGPGNYTLTVSAKSTGTGGSTGTITQTTTVVDVSRTAVSEEETYSFRLDAGAEAKVALTGMTIDFDCRVGNSRCSNHGSTRDDSWSGSLDAGAHTVTVYPYARGPGNYSLTVTATRTLTFVQTPTGMSATICDEDEDGNEIEGSCVDIRIDESVDVTAPPPTVPPPPPPPPPPEPSEQDVDVVLRAYIPSAWVPSLPLGSRCLGRTMIFGGDGRGPSANPPERTVPTGTLEPYRLQAEVVLAPPSGESALRIVGSPDFSAGLTTLFHKGTTLADGAIDDDDYDEEGDCHRLHRTRLFGGEKGSPDLPGGDVLTLELHGSNPLAFGSRLAPINASVELDFRTSETDGLVIDGEITHDCMPAFELYIDGTAAYTWAPSGATLGNPVLIGLCLLRPKNKRGRFRCTGSSQGGFTCRGQ